MAKPSPHRVGCTAGGLAILAACAVGCSAGAGTDPGASGRDVADAADGLPSAAASGARERPPAAASSEHGSVRPEAGDGAGAEATGAARPDASAEPPPGYGVIVPPVPPPDEAELTMHGLAGYEVVVVYAQPDLAARKLGYLRIGHRLRVTPKLARNDGDDGGCPKGWYHLEGGGFACASKGLVVGRRPPYMYREPPPPRIDDVTPYDYAFVRKWNAPMYWRIPTEAERLEAKRVRAEREEARLAAEAAARGEPPPEDVAAAGAAGVGADPGEDRPPRGSAGGGGAATPGTGEPRDRVPGAPSGHPSSSSAAAPGASPAGQRGGGSGGFAGPEESPVQEEPVPEPIRLPLNPSTPWLEKGFFVSLAGKEKDGRGRTYYRTARGGYVAAADVSPYPPKDFKGQILDGLEHPFGWAMDRPTRIYTLDEAGRLRPSRKVEQRTFLDLEERVEHHGRTYYRLSSGELVRAAHVRVPDLQPMPEGLAPWEKWIDVDLGRQVLVAYEGARPVFATLVSTGRKGSEEESFETPTGRFRIRSKHISTTMDGNTASDGNYSIQDVPWAMFFEGSYALHGAFWHRGFGYRRSHGCVNLGPSDAKWLFFWTTPYLPPHFHGVHAQPDTPGTTVVIRP